MAKKATDRKLPELRGFTPALVGMEPVPVDYFDGWTIEEVEEWLYSWADWLREAEKVTKVAQLVVGLALYRALAEEGERAHAELRARVLSQVRVSEATLTRWRRIAEDHYHLPPPSKRVVAQRKRHAIEAGSKLSSGQSTLANQGKGDDGDRGKAQDEAPVGASRSSGRGDRPVEPAPEPEPAKGGTEEIAGVNGHGRPAAPPSNTQDGVRHTVAMVATYGSEVVARCCTEEAIVAAQAVLDGARSLLRQAARGNGRSAEVTPRFKK